MDEGADDDRFVQPWPMRVPATRTWVVGVAGNVVANLISAALIALAALLGKVATPFIRERWQGVAVVVLGLVLLYLALMAFGISAACSMGHQPRRVVRLWFAISGLLGLAGLAALATAVLALF